MYCMHQKVREQNMKIQKYMDEFMNNNYNRDYRIFGKNTRIRHAPKFKTTNTKRASNMRTFITKNINSNIARYSAFYYNLAYFEDILDYQVANDNARIVNHFFFDFDKHNHQYDKITKGNNGVEDLKQITDIQEYYSRMDTLHENVQDLILYSNLWLDAYNEAKKVNDYFKSQGLTVYSVLSGSKGIHLRVYFKPIMVKNYNRIVSDLYHNLQKQFNLHTIDFEVSDKNPLRSVERLPYSYNEKSGLRVLPFTFAESLNELINRCFTISEKKRIIDVPDFNLADYTNTTFSDGILKLDSQIQKLVEKEERAKQELFQEKINKGVINGNYTKGNALFKDLRVLVRFICGDSNLVSEHAYYDKYRCHFHNDKSPSVVVGAKYYDCMSSNCKIGKINYFDFIKEYFNLKSDSEVKDKMRELQLLYDERIGGGENVSLEDGMKV